MVLPTVFAGLADPAFVEKGCVNPKHLEVVTGEENSRRILAGVPGWIDVALRRRVLADEAWMYTATGRLRKVA